MAIKTINLSEDAYERLATRKKENESFTDVVNRLTGKYELSELVGILNEKEALEFKKAARTVSRNLDKSMRRTARRMR